ncbi:hypothetical protein M378DRAFT_154921 [Amanita muscaria Koide BX008]|uniref:Uncharacterized protein n=1 Tax=Amanita muscaria (strain Koide BX008) TaxID=946122 RepID=A0A0C2TVK7_AMAMK|nr:hypothetical protein M378DRAFT_154921 [Amanita muscaria Koide BX008]
MCTELSKLTEAMGEDESACLITSISSQTNSGDVRVVLGSIPSKVIVLWDSILILATRLLS